MQNNETITIYNQRTNRKTRLPEWIPSILCGCSWYTAQKIALDSNGVTSANVYAIRIFPDFLSEEGRSYIPPGQYAKLSEEESGQYWTIQNDDRIVRGSAVIDVKKASDLEEHYEEVAVVTSYSDNRGGLLPHIRVGGV